MRRLMKSILIGGWLLLAGLGGLAADTTLVAPEPDTPEAIVYYDLTPLFALDLKDPAQRRRFWDETHLVVALQGLVNRSAPRLFIRYVQQPDDFWWEQMTAPHGWLAGRTVVRVPSLAELLERFRSFYRGAVVWDERLPATSNLASSIAGCDDLLCLRYDKTKGSLYRRLTEAEPRLAVKVRLLREDGGPLFTGTGNIPDTSLPSTGSAKCDAYLWLIEHYLKTGKANPHRLGYYLDAFWLNCWNVSGPVNHTLSNHDYVIAHRGLLFDLNVWDDEACVDDPDQQLGTDVATLRKLLRAAWDCFGGQGVIHVAGFVPWAFKYTTHHGGNWSAGGKHEPVPTEWRYAEILSCFNAYMDADALGLGAMANASFFQHYPLKKHYAQNPKPTRASLQASGLLDTQGRIVPRRYVAHYVGDYDAAAWLYQQLPRMWRDPARGSTPLSWAFNPNLCERFPLGMAWARERRTTNDFFVAGDSGAGYLNPGNLVEPRRYSGLPSGVAAWEEHCQKLYRRWDLSVTGFIIDGYAPAMSDEVLDAYSRFSPDGIVAQKIPQQGLHRGMPFLRMRTDLPSDPTQAARALYHLAGGSPPQFVVARSILQPPSWYARVERELHKLGGDDVKVVDLYTLFWLVREYETHHDQYADERFAQATVVSGQPGSHAGVNAVYVADGPFTAVQRDGRPCWQLPRHQPPFYLYFKVAEGFLRAGAGPIEIELEYLDEGKGQIELQYDSTDSTAPVDGAYKSYAPPVKRTDTGEWRAAKFRLADARFSGSQNGMADFRFYNAGDDLLVRAVRVLKLKAR